MILAQGPRNLTPFEVRSLRSRRAGRLMDFVGLRSPSIWVEFNWWYIWDGMVCFCLFIVKRVNVYIQNDFFHFSVFPSLSLFSHFLSFQWGRVILRQSTFQGQQTHKVFSLSFYCVSLFSSIIKLVMIWLRFVETNALNALLCYTATYKHNVYNGSYATYQRVY